MVIWTGMRPSKGFLRSFITPLIINHGPPNASIVFVNYGGFIMPYLGGEILLRKPILKQTYQDLVGTFPYHAAIYTHTADIHELERC